MRRVPTRLLLAMAVTAAMAGTVPAASAQAHACEPETDSYNCLIVEAYQHGWRNVTSLTYCFPTSKRTYTYSDSSERHAFPMPANYRKYVQAAANTWTTRPGLRVSLTETACGPKTDIAVRGYRGGEEAGEGGCTPNTDAGSKNYQFCLPRSGRVLINVDIPDTDTYAAELEHTALHEFGHVLGLDHPCGNICPGPIMSYKTCIKTSECVVYPNYDDVVGVQIIYGMRAEAGCSIDPNAPASGAGVAGGIVQGGSSWLPPESEVPGIEVPGVELFEAPDYGAIPRSLTRPRAVVGGDVIAGAVDLVLRLADPTVNASATLETTQGVLSNEMDWVLMEAGADDLVPNPTRCLAM